MTDNEKDAEIERLKKIVQWTSEDWLGHARIEVWERLGELKLEAMRATARAKAAEAKVAEVKELARKGRASDERNAGWDALDEILVVLAEAPAEQP